MDKCPKCFHKFHGTDECSRMLPTKNHDEKIFSAICGCHYSKLGGK